MALTPLLNQMADGTNGHHLFELGDITAGRMK